MPRQGSDFLLYSYHDVRGVATAASCESAVTQLLQQPRTTGLPALAAQPALPPSAAATHASAVPSSVHGIQAPHPHVHVPSATIAATDMAATEHSAATAPDAQPVAAAAIAAAATAVPALA